MENILFTRQFHQAERAGDHYDYRLVSGGKAYSWATRKQMPEPGNSIILWEQPVHTSEYALSKRLVIPKGQYGAGITTLDIVKKAKVHPDSTKDKIKFTTSTGESFLLKKLPEKYGNKAWLFRNISEKDNMEKKAENKYLEKIARMSDIMEPILKRTKGLHYDEINLRKQIALGMAKFNNRNNINTVLTKFAKLKK